MVKRTEEALGFKSQLHACLRVLSSSMGLVIMAPTSWGHSDRYSARTFPRRILTAMEELLLLSQRCGPSETSRASRSQQMAYRCAFPRALFLWTLLCSQTPAQLTSRTDSGPLPS